MVARAAKRYRQKPGVAERQAVYLRAYAKANPDKWRAYHAKRRARERDAEGTHSDADIAEIRRLQSDRCANPACRKALKDGGHVDHIHALSRGGSNWPRNLQLLCKPCNTSKAARDAIDFMQEQGFLL